MVANAEDHAHACAVAAPLAKRAGLTGAELLAGKRGKGEIPELRRQVFAALVAEGWSYPRIGRATGRDHSTIHKVLHSPKKRGAAPEASP
jgi:DNA-directed RNA polymerase specialized sigma24 family protein